MSSTRKSSRINKFNGSFYESDQEDNLKDRDYNPNEFYEKLKESKSATPSPVEVPKIDFTEYMNALSILSGIPQMVLQEKIDCLTLKQKKQLFGYCTRPGSSSILLLEKCIKSVLMKETK